MCVCVYARFWFASLGVRPKPENISTLQQSQQQRQQQNDQPILALAIKIQV